MRESNGYLICKMRVKYVFFRQLLPTSSTRFASAPERRSSWGRVNPIDVAHITELSVLWLIESFVPCRRRHTAHQVARGIPSGPRGKREYLGCGEVFRPLVPIVQGDGPQVQATSNGVRKGHVL